MSPAALASIQHCPCCGRPSLQPRRTPRPADIAPPVDTSRLSDAELFRHYKRTAPVDDLRFFLIRRVGYRGRFGSTYYTYYDIGEHQYWDCGGDPASDDDRIGTTLINRAVRAPGVAVKHER